MSESRPTVMYAAALAAKAHETGYRQGVEAEREACALTCEQLVSHGDVDEAVRCAMDCAAAIRARGER